MKLTKFLFSAVAALAAGFAFAACAAGSMFGTTASGDVSSGVPDASALEPIYRAFADHHPALGVMLLIVLGVAAVKKYFGESLPFLRTDAGGSLMALIAAAAGAAGVALQVPGASLSLGLMENALLVGVSAAGGYAVVKNLIIDPLFPKLPPWLQTLLTPILWIFNKGAKAQAAATQTAEQAGDKAVADKPAGGVSGVVGPVTEIK